MIAVVTGLAGGAACGRTELELAVRDGASDAVTDAVRDATRDGASGGSPATGGRPAPPGSGGRAGTGGTAGRAAPPLTGGASGTGGRVGTGGAAGSGGRVASGGSGGSIDGGVRDAAPDALIADAGPDLPPPTPGRLVCGPETCDVKTQTCCVSLAVGSVGARCVPVGTTCPGAALVCDEPADCPGAVCCFGLQTTGGVGLGSQCSARAACSGLGRFVVCRTNADCGGTSPACCSVGGVPLCQPACPGA